MKDPPAVFERNSEHVNERSDKASHLSGRLADWTLYPGVARSLTPRTCMSPLRHATMAQITDQRRAKGMALIARWVE